ncbi:MAG: hypothetical protein M1817_000307 [Caeruleum heppii]|nr:MAG: hypothetical protein M1817_000307 [Caeruleum heppii]
MLLFYLSLLCVRADAVFDPYNPPLEENFDPRDADPDGNITCVGPLPEWRLPTFPDFDPNTFTLQELCAKPQYGGRAKDQHMAGWCLRNTGLVGEESDVDLVVFDENPRARASRELGQPRLALYCKTRCFCNSEVTNGDFSVQPIPAPQQRTLYVDTSRKAYRISLDLVDDFDEPPANHRGFRGEVLATTIDTASPILEEDQDLDFADDSSALVGIIDENKIDCIGPLPNFPLPAPMDHTHYQNVQHLCAVQLSGGNGIANAGGYCHRNGDGLSEVKFADEMTPRLEWTWDNFYASASVRFHCWQLCRCRLFPTVKNYTGNPTWEVLETMSMIQRMDGSYDARFDGASSKEEAAAASVFVNLLTRNLPGSQTRAAGTCGADGRQFCKAPWPSDLAGPRPTAAAPRRSTAVAGASGPARSSAVGDAPARPPYPQCGTTCLSNRECQSGGSGSGTECRCVAADVETARQQGLDPVFPSALCLLLTQAVTSGRRPYRVNPVNAVGGRSLSGNSPPACACNQTYVSHACCNSVDGMIWEAPGRRLGRLTGPGKP